MNYFQDTNSELYAEPDSGWFSGFIPNSAVHQWQVSVDGGNNWQDLSDGANYSGVNNDTLRIISAPADFDQYEYRLKAYTNTYACSSGDVYSKSALLTVSDAPAWQTAAGSLGEFGPGATISTITITATNATSFAVQSGSLPTGLSLNTGSGSATITGTVSSGITSDTLFSFTVRATDAEAQTADRAFTIQVTVGANNSGQFN